MFPEEFETERLRFVQVSLDTVDPLELYPYHSTEEGIEEATQYMSWNPHQTLKDTWDFVKQVGDAVEAGNGAVYALYPKESENGAGEFAGTTGLHCDWDKHTARFGIWLRKTFWGRGYSGERATKLMEIAFEDLDLDLVAVEHAVENEKSRRAIEKYVAAHGGRLDGMIRNHLVLDGEPHDGLRYSISREEWEASR
ncbi:MULTISPECIES: GNAT family N-acetyltransferase [unclassified Haladaptatus]|uniref:GNAT family N-acetyltransferase n=1 Tax=unclassified Haladaptatus TaxID=2622732 RepID=UPI0023E8D367|nr:MULTISPECIES: GNAT family protein [unclassified Haladaptatus]